MSDYKGFITQAKLVELMNLLRRIGDTRGLENKLHHLYHPDTDMNDNICEDFITSQWCIMNDIHNIMRKCIDLGDKILEIEVS